MRTLVLLKAFDPELLSTVKELRGRGEEIEVVLLQDAVYLALRDSKHSEAVYDAIRMGVKFHLLTRDVERRGVLDRVFPDLSLIDYGRLVDLLFGEGTRVLNV